MTLDDPKAQEKLTPDERRTLLRAFADRMLLKTAAMDDPEDMPGVERAVRVMAVIERVYSRCDRSEAHTPDPRKLEADRARNAKEAIQARVSLAGTLQWGEDRRKDLGTWWDAADTTAQKPTPAPPPAQSPLAPLPGLPQAPEAKAEIKSQIHAESAKASAPPADPIAPQPAPVRVPDTANILKAIARMGLDAFPEVDANPRQRYTTGGYDPPD